MPATVTLLTDYGLQDEYVGVCHGVIARIAPEARVIDLTHGVPRHAIRAGALALRRALPFTPPGVHVAVVDPGVGGPRRGIAVRCGDRLLVGPDNGLLMPAAEHLGGVEEAVDLASSPWLLEPVSATFHGRDVFAPVAAHLALGEPLARAGGRCRSTSSWRWRCRSRAARASRSSRTRSRSTRTATCCSTPPAATCPAAERVEVAGRWVARGRTFGDVPDGELLLYEDSSGALALAVNGGSARDELNLRLDDEIRIA